MRSSSFFTALSERQNNIQKNFSRTHVDTPVDTPASDCCRIGSNCRQIDSKRKGYNLPVNEFPAWCQSLFCLILSAFLCLVTLPFRTLYFMEPDDYLLNFIANGSYGWKYSENLVYIRTSIGYLLKGLYHLTGAVNWYAVLLLLVILCSFAVFYDILWLRTRSAAALLLTASLNFLAVPGFFTYTAAAFFSACAGLLLLEDGLFHRRDAKNTGAVELTAGIVFFYFRSALRKDTIVPELILCFPIAVYSFLHTIRGCASKVKKGDDKRFSDGHSFRSSKTQNADSTACCEMPSRISNTKNAHSAIFRRILPALLAGILLFGGDAVIQSSSYGSDTWKFFSSFNEARTSVVDYNRLSYDLHKTELESAGLSATDYDMLCSWKFADKKVFTIDGMTAAGRLARHSLSLAERMADARQNLQGANLQIFLLPAAAWVFLLFLNFARRRKRILRPILLPGLTLLMWYLLCAALLLYRMRFVTRVAAPLMITAVAWILLSGLGQEQAVPVHGSVKPEQAVPSRRNVETEQAAPDRGSIKPDTDKFSGRNSVRKRACGSVIFIILAIAAMLLTVGIEVTCTKDFLASTQDHRQEGNTTYHSVKEEIAADSSRLCIIDGYVLSMLYYYDRPVKDVLCTDTFQNIVRSGSWDSFSGRYYLQAESLKLADPDRPLLSLVTAPGTIFVSQDASLMQAFLSEQTGKKIQTEEKNMGTDIHIYRFRAIS